MNVELKNVNEGLDLAAEISDRDNGGVLEYVIYQIYRKHMLLKNTIDSDVNTNREKLAQVDMYVLVNLLKEPLSNYDQIGKILRGEINPDELC